MGGDADPESSLRFEDREPCRARPALYSWFARAERCISAARDAGVCIMPVVVVPAVPGDVRINPARSACWRSWCAWFWELALE